ncbi:MAG: PfkB family carbohydrate kinase [Candidatus Nanoarchaeia archaeon]
MDLFNNIPMKVAVVGNICKRTEIRNNKKSKQELAGSYIAAINASKLGYDTTLISRVPDNSEVIEQAKKNKIKLEKQSAWIETIYESTYNKNDEKTTKVVSDAGPIVRVNPGNYDVVLISSYYGYVSFDVIKSLKTPNNILCLDVQSYIKHRGDNGVLFYKPWLDKEKYLKYVDVIKLNTKELFYLTGKISLNSASDLLHLGPKVVILTVENKCNYIFHDKTYLKMPFYKGKTKPKCVIGTGELYDAAFTLKYAETKDPKEAGFFAEAAVSIALERDCVKKPLSPTEVNKRFKLLKDIFLA